MNDCLEYLQENGYEDLSDNERIAAIEMNETACHIAQELNCIGE
jgi:hypothetical protein